MRPVHCLVYGGTSSIVAPLIRRAPPNIHFTLLSRKESERDEKKLTYLKTCVSIRSSTQICFYDDTVSTGTMLKQLSGLDYDVVLVLTTKPDPAALAYVERPILYIGSGSVTDTIAQRVTWTEYSLNKFWPERFATLTLRCGFFIPDVEGEVVPPAGVGMDSAKQIWSKTVVPPTSWLGKSMYVTPVSSLVQAICNWINQGQKEERLSGIFHFGTQHPLSRAHLRNQACLPMPLDFVYEALSPVYEKEWENTKKRPILDVIPDTFNDVGGACKRAAAWINTE